MPRFNHFRLRYLALIVTGFAACSQTKNRTDVGAAGAANAGTGGKAIAGNGGTSHVGTGGTSGAGNGGALSAGAGGVGGTSRAGGSAGTTEWDGGWGDPCRCDVTTQCFGRELLAPWAPTDAGTSTDSGIADSGANDSGGADAAGPDSGSGGAPADAGVDGAGMGGAGPSIPCPQNDVGWNYQWAPCDCGSWYRELESETPESCCYHVEFSGAGGGRPFLVGGEVRRAKVISNPDWSQAPSPLTSALSVRELLRDEWTRDAQLEHASIASFARFTLELMALGAPPQLLMAAQRAAADEIRHAQDCFALASRYAGRAVGPAALDVTGSLEIPDLDTFAVSCFVEGCIGETVAALIAEAQLDVVQDDQVRETLQRIAEDEATHAELAWLSLAWAIPRGTVNLKRRLQSALDTAMAQSALVAQSLSLDEVEQLHAHGRLTQAERQDVREHCLAEVIEPCLKALLGGSARHAASAVTQPRRERTQFTTYKNRAER
ncbi:MAG: ferritin-like domain-containing protein [Polyangiaceae bacterium]|nr:ferritin-like domain-containing protein [Polyangiaceae bacterium]